MRLRLLIPLLQWRLSWPRFVVLVIVLYIYDTIATTLNLLWLISYTCISHFSTCGILMSCSWKIAMPSWTQVCHDRELGTSFINQTSEQIIMSAHIILMYTTVFMPYEWIIQLSSENQVDRSLRFLFAYTFYAYVFQFQRWGTHLLVSRIQILLSCICLAMARN